MIFDLGCMVDGEIGGSGQVGAISNAEKRKKR